MQAPKRILLVISNLTYGGAERQVVEIANGLDRARYDVHVCILSNHAPLASALNDPSRLHRIPKHNKFDVSVVLRLAGLMRKLKTDVVHGFLFDAEIASRLAGKLAGVRTVIGSERNSSHNYKRLNLLAYRWTSRLMTVCVANSEAGRRFNQQTFGLPDDSYRVVYNGVDIERFRPRSKPDARAHLGLSGDNFVIGMIGSFKRQKNHPYILRTIAELARQRQDFYLLLVGTTVFEGDADSAAYFASIQEMISAMGLTDRVKLAGARDDVERVINACDITVLPSLFEGTPNVVLESLASGVPVVATDVADNRTLIPEGKVGFVVGLEEEAVFAGKIASLLEDDELRGAMSVSARQWVEERFSVQTMVNNMARVYDSV
ncbi:MAG: glycosyltransferase [Pseudomonadota bacterium]